MTTRFNLYRQKRQDGGVRTGLECDDGSILQSFQPVDGEDDPALLWYVDLRGQIAADLDASQVRDWLRSHGATFQSGLQHLAERFSAGIDLNAFDWPFRERLPIDVPDATIDVVFSAIRRLDALEIGDNLNALADNWDEMLVQLQPIFERI